MSDKFLIWDSPVNAIFTLTVILMCLGCINVYSASFVSAITYEGNPYYYMIKFASYGFLGLVCMYIIGFYVPYRKFYKCKWLIYGAMILGLLAVKFFGTGMETTGAQRWISIAGSSVQPSEFVKIGVIFVTACDLGKLMQQGIRPSLLNKSTLIPFGMALILGAMVYLQPDMGTAVFIVGLAFFLYILAGLPSREILGISTLGIGTAAVLAFAAEYRRQRVLVWLNPWRDPLGDGYQMVQSLITIGSGGLFGLDVGMGSGKFFFLPEPHTDFAFAIWCQEWGFCMAALLIVLFLVLGAAIYRVGQCLTDEVDYLLVSGINCFVIGQALTNMAMVCGIIPVTGVPLTFISYGGTALLCALVSLGLVVASYNNEKKKMRLKRPTSVEEYRRSRQVSSAAR